MVIGKNVSSFFSKIKTKKRKEGNQISVLKKTTFAIIVAAAILISVVGIIMVHNGKTNSSLTVKKMSLKLQEIALAKKQPVKKQQAESRPVQNQQIQKKAVKKKPVEKQPAKKQPVQKNLVKKQPILAESKILDVPLINQLDAPRIYNGCEVTSLAMILNYNGYHVSKNQLADHIETVPLTYQSGLKGNPNVGFVGNMKDGPGYAVYNGPVYRLARIYAGDKVVNLTNHPFIDLLKRVSQGEPVWIITTETFAPVSDFEKWHTPEGTIKTTFSEHSVVITGYDKNFIYINNPYGQKNERLNRSQFEEAWEQMGRQAIVIEK